MSTALQELGKRLTLDPQELQNIIFNTVMPNKGREVTQDQFATFVAVANEYKLNPLTKEIYAFPTKGGGIQPIVSIDGWLKIINNHDQFNGMEFVDEVESGELISVTCRIFRKDRDHPTEMTEYMDECKQNTDPWKKFSKRMLRHKSTIQAARYAFGLSGIIDEDEANRYKDSGVIEEKDVTPPTRLITQEQKQNVADMLNSLDKTWEGLSKVTPSYLGREVHQIGDLSEAEATKTIELLKSRLNDS